MEFDPGHVEKFLAPYLREDRKAGFLEALKDFPPKKPFYCNLDDPDPLQGDCWSGVTVIDFGTGSRDQVKGLVLSNSCDVASDNQRHRPVGLNFAPIIALVNYRALLMQGLRDPSKVESHMADVRDQKISSIFYLPDVGELGGESLVLLDNVHTVPLDYFSRQADKRRIFALSDVAFWLFMFKLSFHFCRLHENVDRTPPEARGEVPGE